MRKADMWSGTVLIAVSAAFILGGLRMPWRSSEWGVFAAPGLVPVALAVVIACLGLILIIRSAVSPGFYEALEASRQCPCASSDDQVAAKPGGVTNPLFRVAMVIGLCGLYAFALLGRVSYPVATATFVAGFILAFKGGGLIKAGLIGAITSVTVWLVFERVFYVFLP